MLLLYNYGRVHFIVMMYVSCEESIKSHQRMSVLVHFMYVVMHYVLLTAIYMSNVITLTLPILPIYIIHVHTFTHSISRTHTHTHTHTHIKLMSLCAHIIKELAHKKSKCASCTAVYCVMAHERPSNHRCVTHYNDCVLSL